MSNALPARNKAKIAPTCPRQHAPIAHRRRKSLSEKNKKFVTSYGIRGRTIAAGRKKPGERQHM
jgi:hypothetical protein